MGLNDRDWYREEQREKRRKEIGQKKSRSRPIQRQENEKGLGLIGAFLAGMIVTILGIAVMLAKKPDSFDGIIRIVRMII